MASAITHIPGANIQKSCKHESIFEKLVFFVLEVMHLTPSSQFHDFMYTMMYYRVMHARNTLLGASFQSTYIC